MLGYQLNEIPMVSIQGAKERGEEYLPPRDEKRYTEHKTNNYLM